jgi:hypothetical protein
MPVTSRSEGPRSVTAIRQTWDISELLDRLHCRGVYSVELLECELGPFGFVYDRDRGQLWHERGVTALTGRTTDQVRRAGENHGLHYTGLDSDGDEDLLVEAADIVRAVYRLLHPGQMPPSSRVRGPDRRCRGFNLDLVAIRRAGSSPPH